MKFHRYPLQRVRFDNFTNCCYPGMLAYQKNYLPHTDRFGIAANLYLTDPELKHQLLFIELNAQVEMYIIMSLNLVGLLKKMR